MIEGYTCNDPSGGTGACGSSTSTTPARGDYENILMSIVTDGAGNAQSVEGFLVQGDGGFNNTWVAWTFSAVIPVPAAAWLFGSALGALGWYRRRKVTADY